MENMELEFFKNKKIFLTGHTGFKGSWLTLLLNNLGAEVKGYSLPPEKPKALFANAKCETICENIYGDIRQYENLFKEIDAFQPEFVFHLAAQPLVRASYYDPRLNYETNVQGTVNLLEVCRNTSSVKSIIVITTDKVYENKEWCWGYRETDPLGGFDPYSSSKACAEIVSQSYYNSFFKEKNIGLVTVRAGNVIGGGDWAKDRLIPDLIRAYASKSPIEIRYPNAIRPWQHVLDALYGYLHLTYLLHHDSHQYSGPWNFGPNPSDFATVSKIVEAATNFFDKKIVISIPENSNLLHETQCLKLDISKSVNLAKWTPKWNLDQSLKNTFEWYKDFLSNKENAAQFCLRQIKEFLNEK